MKIDELKFIKLDDDHYKNYVCPLCGGTIKVHDSVFYGRCDTCLVTLLDYKPATHQVNFHKSKARYRLNIGGFGSGKTVMGAAEVATHAYEVSNGRTVIVAQTLSQVKEAVLPELERFLAPWLLKKRIISPLPKFTLNNGHEIIVYTSNNEEKLRSLNLTAFWMVEASGIEYKVFTQLQTRLRNNAAVVKDEKGNEIEHKFMGIVESNPEEGWIRDEMLLRSSVIKASKNVDVSSYEKLRAKKSEPAYHSFLSATPDNPYLHKNFISDITAGKDDRWIRKYIYCYLEVKEGAVYPDFINCLVDPFPMDNPQSTKHWPRICGFDKGWTDETCLAVAAIDPISGVCYIYDEYYESQKPITYHATKIKEKIFGLPMYKPIQADPSVRNANDRDGVSYKDYFRNVSGLELAPANNNISDGIERVRDFMYTGKLKFFTSCVNIREEAGKYVFKQNRDGTGTDDPVDRNNHLMDAVRYLVMGLPMDLTELGPSGATSGVDKFNLINRIQPDSNIDDLLNFGAERDGIGGVYGLGTFI